MSFLVKIENKDERRCWKTNIAHKLSENPELYLRGKYKEECTGEEEKQDLIRLENKDSKKKKINLIKEEKRKTERRCWRDNCEVFESSDCWRQLHTNNARFSKLSHKNRIWNLTHISERETWCDWRRWLGVSVSPNWVCAERERDWKKTLN